MVFILLVVLVTLNSFGTTWFVLRSFDEADKLNKRAQLVYAGAFAVNVIAFLSLYARFTTVFIWHL